MGILKLFRNNLKHRKIVARVKISKNNEHPCVHYPASPIVNILVHFALECAHVCPPRLCMCMCIKYTYVKATWPFTS